MHLKKRESNIEYQMGVRHSMQKNHVTDRVCMKYGKKICDELPTEGKEEIKDIMRVYDIRLVREARRKKVLELLERKNIATEVIFSDRIILQFTKFL